MRNKSHFVPPQGREDLLDNFVLSTANIPLEPFEKSNVKINISISEQRAITSLSNDDTVIIKQADKITQPPMPHDTKESNSGNMCSEKSFIDV